MKQTTRVLSVLLALLMAFSFTALAASSLTVTATYNDADIDGATIPAGSDILLTFSANVTDESVLANNLSKIKVKDANGSPVDAVVSKTGAKKITVTLGSDLAKGSYTLTIGKKLADVDGNTLGEEFARTFTVKGSGSGTGGGDKKLEIASVTANDAPLEGATLKAGDTIVILFTNGMTDNGAESAKLISVTKADGTAVPCEVTYPKDKSDDVLKKQFTVKLGDDVEGGSYKLVIGAGVKANNGNTLGQDAVIAFTVEAAEVVEPAAPTFIERVRQFLFDLLDKLANWFRTLPTGVPHVYFVIKEWFASVKAFFGSLIAAA